MVNEVKSGDPANVEARAARKYWTALFGSDFRRDRNATDHNILLNYGYAVLRAVTARAICSAGLHPSLGLHHRNRYNPWCLADDLMEPYRPFVDGVVNEIIEDHDTIPEFNQSTRISFLELLTGTLEIDEQQRTFFDALSKTASSLASFILGENDRLKLPEGKSYATS